MKTKIKLLCIFSLTTFLTANSQIITVLSKEDKQPLPGANIVFSTYGSRSMQFITTDKSGKAMLPCGKNDVKHILSVSFMGYEKLNDTINCEDKVYMLQPALKKMNEVVVTAQYRPSGKEQSVYNVHVIGSKEMERRGANTLKDLLSQELNIKVTQDNVLGSGMTMNGLSGENIKILIDGVPVIGRTNGNIDLSQISLNNIEQVEIVEGPLSVNYGTNALGGAINLITKKTQYERIEAGLDTYYETAGQYNTNVFAGYKFGTNTIQFTGARNYFDGWHRNDKLFDLPKVAPADTLRFQDWKPKEQYMGGIHYHKNFQTLQLHLVSNYFKEQVINKGMPHKPYYETAFDDYYRTYRWDNAVSLSGKINKYSSIQVQLAYNSYNRIKNTYFKDLTTLQEQLADNADDQDTIKFNLLNVRGTYASAKDSSRINYEVGYDINIDKGYGARIEGKDKQIGDYALYTSAEYTPLKIITEDNVMLLTLRPGLRYAYNTAYKAPIVPSLHLLFKPKNKITIRASYARGFRAPGLKELYFEFVDINHNIHGNPDLKAETSNSYQTSVSFSGSSGRRFWRITPSFFYNDINNLITLSFTGEENKYAYINVGEYNTYGGQIHTEFGEQELTLSLGGSIYWTHSVMMETMQHGGYTHTMKNIIHGYTPELQAAVKYRIIKTDTRISVFHKYSGKMLGYHYDENQNIQQHWMDAYPTLDVTISQPFFRKRMVLAFGSKNIMNVKYVGMSGMQHTGNTGAHGSSSMTMPVNWGRSFFINLKINLSKRIQ